MLREVWFFVGLEWRRWRRKSGLAFVAQRAIQTQNGRTTLWLAASFSALLLFGIFIWIFSLMSLSLKPDRMAWVFVIFPLSIFLHPLLQPFPQLADEEWRFLQAFPYAPAASLLGRLVWNQWKAWGFSAAILGAAAVAQTLINGSNPALLLAWWLYQTVGLSLGLLIKVVAHFGHVRPGAWERRLKKSKLTNGLWTGLAKWLMLAAVYFVGGLIAYHLIIWAWRTVQSGWNWVVIDSAIPSQWKGTIVSILFHPSPVAIVLAATILATVVIVLPFIIYVLVRSQLAWERESDVHLSDYKPHSFTGNGMTLVMQKDLLHFIRVPRSQKALASLATAFFMSGFLVEMARLQSFGRYPWGLLMVSLIGAYGVTFFAQDVVRQTTGPEAEGDRFTLYRLTAICPESVIWGKVLLSAAMMVIPAFALGAVLVTTNKGSLLWMPAAVLIGIVVPFLEALAHTGIPAFLALTGQASDEGRNSLQAKVIPEIFSVGYFILWFDVLGIPTIFSIAGKENMVPQVGWAYAAILVPVVLLAGTMHWWWQRRFARC